MAKLQILLDFENPVPFSTCAPTRYQCPSQRSRACWSNNTYGKFENPASAQMACARLMRTAQAILRQSPATASFVSSNGCIRRPQNVIFDRVSACFFPLPRSIEIAPVLFDEPFLRTVFQVISSYNPSQATTSRNQLRINPPGIFHLDGSRSPRASSRTNSNSNTTNTNTNTTRLQSLSRARTLPAKSQPFHFRRSEARQEPIQSAVGTVCPGATRCAAHFQGRPTARRFENKSLPLTWSL